MMNGIKPLTTFINVINKWNRQINLMNQSKVNTLMPQMPLIAPNAPSWTNSKIWNTLFEWGIFLTSIECGWKDKKIPSNV